MTLHHLSLLVALFLSVSAAVGQNTAESARDAVANMRLGWNLGNTLDSNSGDVNNLWIEHWTDRSPAQYEKAWGQEPTTQALIDMFRDAGFNAIRIPVTWWPHMVREWKFASSGNSIWDQQQSPMEQYIDPVWMARVRETVDYVIRSGMYCILNVHHDTGDGTTNWLRASTDNYARNREMYEYLWRSIAEEFRDYDHHLLFEGYNEMLDDYGSWCFASFAAPGNYNATSAADSYRAINSYTQSFVSTVRGTGGNNAHRNLVVNTYGCCNGDGTWNAHLVDPLTSMSLPVDEADGHLILQVHYYPNFETLAAGKSNTDNLIRLLQTRLESKGAPVIIGEWGSGGGAGYDKNRTIYLQWARYFVEQTRKAGIGTFYWMGLCDGEARSVPKFNQDDLREAMVKGYYGDGGYETSVDDIADGAEHTLVDVYNLNGMLLLRGLDRSQLHILPSGLYFVDGQKVFVQ